MSAGSEGDTVRQCALTRERRPQGELIRFVAGPEGAVVPDLKAKLPGRGVWLLAARDVVAEAARTGAFSRALKRPVKADAGLEALVERLLEKSAIERLSLANKAGSAVAGYTKVEEALKKGRVAVLLHARDAAADGRSKLDRKGAAKGVASLSLLDAGQLGLAFGRSNVIHAALTLGGASANFLSAVERLERFRAGRAGFSAADPAA